MGKIGISIGWNCHSAVKGVEMCVRSKKSEGYNTCPFDEAITNYDGIVNCINDDFKYFYDLELIKVSDENKYCTGDILIRNVKYNFIFNHESPGHANLWQTQGWEGGKEHYINNEYDKFKQRYNKRIDNFRRYLNSGEEIIFILTVPLPFNTYNLENVLKEKYPNLTYNILKLDLEMGEKHYINQLKKISL